MKLNWDSLLEPIFLFILALIAGTLWVIIPMDPKHDASLKLPASLPPAKTEPSLQSIALTSTPLVHKLAEMRQEVALRSAEAQESEAQSGLTSEELRQLTAQNEQLANELRKEQQNLDKVTGEIHALERQAAQAQAEAVQVAQHNRELASETEALRRLLAEKQSEAGRLESQLAANRRSNREIPYVPTASRADKLPVLVDLIHNRAVPVTRGDFRFQRKLSGPALAQRISTGETIAEMQRPDSATAKFLGTIKPDRQYISCLLNADSFEVFRELRRLAHARNIDVGWEPADTSSGDIVIYPVRLTKNADVPQKNQKLPRIAPIMH